MPVVGWLVGRSVGHIVSGKEPFGKIF